MDFKCCEEQPEEPTYPKHFFRDAPSSFTDGDDSALRTYDDDELLDFDFPSIPDRFFTDKSTGYSFSSKYSFDNKNVKNIGYRGNRTKNEPRLVFQQGQEKNDESSQYGTNCCWEKQQSTSPQQQSIQPNTEFGGQFVSGTNPLSPIGEHDEEDFPEKHQLPHEKLPSDEYDLDLKEASDGVFVSRNKSLATKDELALKHILPSGQMPLGYSRKDATRQRRRVLQACFFLSLASLFLISVLFINDKQRRSNAVGQSLSAKPTLSPTIAPTIDFTKSRAYVTIAPRVEDPLLLLDPNTPQGKAFRNIFDENLDNDFRILQRFAAITFFYSTGATEYTSWTRNQGWKDFDEDECSWDGVTCTRLTDGDMAIAGIDLNNNNLVGSLPSELCLLTDLKILILSNSVLYDEIPSCMTLMPELKTLDLRHNRLSGEFPNKFFLAPSLQHLMLSENRLTGNIEFPRLYGNNDWIAQFTKFKTLRLDNNRLTGEVGEHIVLLYRLKILTLHGNDLSGTLSLVCRDYFELLTADCEELTCSCCTQCF